MDNEVHYFKDAHFFLFLLLSTLAKRANFELNSVHRLTLLASKQPKQSKQFELLLDYKFLYDLFSLRAANDKQ